MADHSTDAGSSEEGSTEQRRANRYSQIIERLFFKHYEEGVDDILFERIEMENIAAELGVSLPKNIGDVVYSMRYRGRLPASVVHKAPSGKEWVILPSGRSRYRFHATDPDRSSCRSHPDAQRSDSPSGFRGSGQRYQDCS